MIDQIRILISVLKVSVKNNGFDKPLTLGHLLNILQLVKKYEYRIEELEEIEHNAIINESQNNGQD